MHAATAGSSVIAGTGDDARWQHPAEGFPGGGAIGRLRITFTEWREHNIEAERVVNAALAGSMSQKRSISTPDTFGTSTDLDPDEYPRSVRCGRPRLPRTFF
jgi:hypothetical protein